MKQILYMLGIVIVVSCLIGLVVALPNPHSLSGRVYDSIGNPVKGVEIVVTNERTGAQLYMVTNEFGEYQQDAYNFAGSYKDSDTIKYYARYKNGAKIYNDAIIDVAKGGTKIDLLFVFSMGFVTPRGSYPSVAGTHTGTITPSTDIVVDRLVTRACEGTGGHTKSIMITNGNNVWEATWNGYEGDYGTFEFETGFTLEAGVTYSYTIVTGSYPQIIHSDRLEVPAGVITCESFVDSNGASYWNWIPSIRLGEKI